ncbi:hypothetical protein OBBRIDRAFT_105080 [Obba rivulosa]|uniref:Uncharacterized protein n=1 Tax=Obba rivulosa TaxID=1052685 RepID=A0A8E2DJT8_9APHY|nr:hypothetical protein OBBRIDRAFT_105080 [Obba rivulosa]
MPAARVSSASDTGVSRARCGRRREWSSLAALQGIGVSIRSPGNYTFTGTCRATGGLRRTVVFLQGVWCSQILVQLCYAPHRRLARSDLAQ